MDEQNESCHVVLIDQHRHRWLLMGGCTCRMLGEIILISWRTEVGVAAARQREGKLETPNSPFCKNGICKNG